MIGSKQKCLIKLQRYDALWKKPVSPKAAEPRPSEMSPAHPAKLHQRPEFSPLQAEKAVSAKL
jgi:hypothetical protein